jgi:hypothetical protein
VDSDRERAGSPDLAGLAGLLADGTRAAFCLALLDGRAWTARRPLVRSCLDWTERRPHLAGVAGAALCDHAMTSRWITRIGTGRAVALTDAGRDALGAHLGLALDTAASALDLGSAAASVISHRRLTTSGAAPARLEA